MTYIRFAVCIAMLAAAPAIAQGAAPAASTATAPITATVPVTAVNRAGFAGGSNS